MDTPQLALDVLSYNSQLESCPLFPHIVGYIRGSKTYVFWEQKTVR